VGVTLRGCVAKFAVEQADITKATPIVSKIFFIVKIVSGLMNCDHKYSLVIL
jgi:hypothetical protein